MKVTPNFDYGRLREAACRGNKDPATHSFFPVIYKGIHASTMLKDRKVLRAVHLCGVCPCREACFELGSTFGGPGIYGGWWFPDIGINRPANRTRHPINLLEAMQRA